MSLNIAKDPPGNNSNPFENHCLTYKYNMFLFFLTAAQYSFVCIYHSFFVQSLIDRHFGLFWNFAITSCAFIFFIFLRMYHWNRFPIVRLLHQSINAYVILQYNGKLFPHPLGFRLFFFPIINM